jgi:hypothetical protein
MLQRVAPAWIGARVGDGVGFGVGDGVGLGVCDGVGLGIGIGVGVGVGLGVGLGAGLGVTDAAVHAEMGEGTPARTLKRVPPSVARPSATPPKDQRTSFGYEPPLTVIS